MDYQVTDTNWIAPPKLKTGDATKVVVYVNVTTSIVGQTYDGFNAVDTVPMEFPITMTGVQMEAETQVQAIAFSTAKYPNT